MRHFPPVAAFPWFMQLLIDFVPIAVFIAAYFFKDIFFATAVLMATMPVVLLLQWLLTRKVSRMYVASTILVLILGSATLLYRNPTFMYWKPTVLYWLAALVFAGSHWIGRKTIVERMMGHAAELTAKQWQHMNLMWVAFFVVAGAINLYVAYNFSQQFWVGFKGWGMLSLMVIFIVIQSIWLSLNVKSDAPAEDQR